MPYIGRAATNTGSVRYLDNIASGFDGSDTTFTAQVGGVNITPDQENVEIYLDGVFQHPGSGNAYTISGSTITFTEAPVANTVFTGYVVGAGAYLDDKAVSSAKLDDDAVTAAKLDDDGTGFQVGDLGVGGSLTSGDKLTVTGRVRVSGGIIGDLTGDVTGDVTGNTSGTAATVTGAAQTNITSLGTLTSLTVDDMTLNGSTISDAGAFDIDAGGVIKLDAGGGQIQFFDDGTEIGVLENSSSDFVIESKVQDKDILFKGNDGGTGIELMRMNMSGANVGISTGNSIGAKLHVADNRSTAYSSTGEPNETIIAHNKNGSDGSGVNNYASLAFAVADGATSQGFLNYKRTGDNTGEFTFSQRTGSSSYAEHMKIANDGAATFAGAITINTSDSEQLMFKGATSPYLRFYESTTAKAYMQWHSDGYLILENSEASTKLAVGANGVGIGTTSPGDILEIDGTNPILKIGNRIRIKADESNATAWYGIGSDLNTINFSDADFGTAWMTIKGATGKVGIGTTAPDQVLHCKVASGDPSIVCETASGGGARLKLIGTDTNMSIQSSGGLLFYTGSSTTANGTDRMRFTSDGKLGIGNGLNPGNMFQVQAADGESDNTAVARFQNLESTNNRSKGIHISAGSTNDDWAIHVDDHDSSNTLMRLCGNAYLGIAEANPDHLLTISHNDDTDITSTNIWNGDCSGIHLRKTHDDSGGGSVIKFSADSHTSVAAIAMSQPNSAGDSFLHFYTSDNTTAAHMAERMKIDNSGYITMPNLNQTGSTNNRYPLYWVHDGSIGSLEPYTGSVRAMKKDIADMGSVDWINSLRPRSFKFRDFEDVDGVRTYKDTTNDNPITEYGLIAEEVDEVEGSDYIVDKDSNGKVKGVLYHNLVPILLKALQEQNERIKALENA